MVVTVKKQPRGRSVENLRDKLSAIGPEGRVQTQGLLTLYRGVVGYENIHTSVTTR